MFSLGSACVSGDLGVVEGIVNGVIATGVGGMSDVIAEAGEEKGTTAIPSSSSLPPPPPLSSFSQQHNNDEDDDHLPWTIADLLNTPFSLEGYQHPLSTSLSNTPSQHTLSTHPQTNLLPSTSRSTLESVNLTPLSSPPFDPLFPSIDQIRPQHTLAHGQRERSRRLGLLSPMSRGGPYQSGCTQPSPLFPCANQTHEGCVPTRKRSR